MTRTLLDWLWRSMIWVAVGVWATAFAAAQDPGTSRLLRTPTASATHIAFAYANNIWVVERAGGRPAA